ncbi:fibropellin-3-like [Argopecten irradians]|uniref:fibropellin-3-like n=1 Tax=Argopecten irradians TaxID=31199 RepID=UPI0037213317
MEQPSYPHFNCTCGPNYEGITCEKRRAFQSVSVTSMQMSPCKLTPCKNGGTCSPHNVMYRCDCTPGYTGTNCDTAVTNTAP